MWLLGVFCSRAASRSLILLLGDWIRTASLRVTHGAGILAGLFDCFPVGGMPSFSVAGGNVNLGLGKQAKSHRIIKTHTHTEKGKREGEKHA